ncbi:MAG: DUF1150 family protein [Geminicoccaceae bacterium]|nr:MAG: DUF1150 family protein [Geminicoccaceae bacterium]
MQPNVSFVPVKPHPAPAETYVKPIRQRGRRFYAIHAQDGRPIALAASRELAFAFLGQHDLTGADVH